MGDPSEASECHAATGEKEGVNFSQGWLKSITSVLVRLNKVRDYIFLSVET